jgi:hypothetical protein
VVVEAFCLSGHRLSSVLIMLDDWCCCSGWHTLCWSASVVAINKISFLLVQKKILSLIIIMLDFCLENSAAAEKHHHVVVPCAVHRRYAQPRVQEGLEPSGSGAVRSWWCRARAWTINACFCFSAAVTVKENRILESSSPSLRLGFQEGSLAPHTNYELLV